MKGKPIEKEEKEEEEKKKKEVKAFQAEDTTYAKIGRLQGFTGCLLKGKKFFVACSELIAYGGWSNWR